MSKEKNKGAYNIKLGFQQNSVFRLLVVGTVLGLKPNLRLCLLSRVCKKVWGFTQNLYNFGSYSEISPVHWAFFVPRVSQGYRSCVKLVKLNKFVGAWSFCVNLSTIAFGLWTLRTSRTRGCGIFGYTLICSVWLVLLEKGSLLSSFGKYIHLGTK